MKILVTGGGGFVGSHVIERLLARGYAVRSIGRSSQPLLEAQGVEVVCGDLTDASAVSAACEGDWSVENLGIVGERIWNLEKQFNLAAGLTIADDTLPKRMLNEPVPSGAGKGKVCELDKMLPEYYELRGWDRKGVPTKETLTRLSLN